MNRILHLLVPLFVWLMMPAALALDCTGLAPWNSATAYNGGAKVQHLAKGYQASWWTQGNDPSTHSGPWQEWKKLGDCDGGGGNQLPTVMLTAPSNGDAFAENVAVILSANASDSDGTISNVEFWLDGVLLVQDSSAPYSTSWTARAGSHSIYAKAFDDKNASAQSATASVTVTTVNNLPPQAAITAPTSGSAFAVGDTVTLSATASDSDGTVSKVGFYLNGALLRELTAAPYSMTWTATAGSFGLYAKATDNKGASADSSAVNFQVGDGGGSHETCRPDGLLPTAAQTPYCTVYDQNGREKLGSNHSRRIIGYFTSWRTGKNGAPAYLASNIPWAKLSHINYAFAHVDGSNKVSIGNADDPNNPATGLQWPGVVGAEMDTTLPYKGHFNLLTRYKRLNPHVKTLVSVGGWAETGGYFDDNGVRVASGGFFTMTTNADNSVNQAGINTFADSAVQFIRRYGFDGVDIDYEYPSSMNDSGNPDDFAFSNPRRAGLVRSYVALMKTLREKIDAAGAQDGKHYLLTIAAPSSGYLVRGMETFPITQFIDYVNIMSYDLHGAWNQFVGPNAALYDTGEDSELIAWNYYNTAQYKRIGYLNTDWAYHYFRGSMPAGRINIGVPYYSRGWKDVQGGRNGLWGTAALPDQSKCPPGTGGSTTNKCGVGAIGIDNLWHDLDAQGLEMGAGSNPMWHAKNLQDGRSGSYISGYGLDPVNDPADRLTGTYVRNYESTAVAPWLWNDSKKVFLSTEDEESINTKAQYVADRGIGGVMFWELAGDYGWNSSRGEYYMGDTLTTALYTKLRTAPAYGNKRAKIVLPTTSLDVRFAFEGFKLGDANYPLNPKLVLKNLTTQTVPGGTEFSFDVATAAPDNFSDQSGFGTTVIQSGANPSGHNIGGLLNDFHRVSVKLPAWQTIAAGQSVSITLNYYLPITSPSNWIIKAGTKTFALAQEYPQLPAGTLDGGTGGGDCAAKNVDPTTVNVYPNWTRTDHANGGDLMSHLRKIYRANWWTNSVPSGSDGSWTLVCSY